MGSAAGLGSSRFPKSRRLLTRGAFTRVQREGIAGRSGLVVVLVAQRAEPAADGEPEPARIDAPAPLAEPARLGIVASRKVGSAVVRNLAKRRVREWFRRQRTAAGLDVLVIVLPSAARATTSELAAALDAALGRALRRAGIAPTSAGIAPTPAAVATSAAGIAPLPAPGPCGGPSEAPR